MSYALAGVWDARSDEMTRDAVNDAEITAVSRAGYKLIWQNYWLLFSTVNLLSKKLLLNPIKSYREF